MDRRLNIYELADEPTERFVEIKEERKTLLIEQGKVVCIIFEEGTLPIGGLQGIPVMMPPVAVVTDAQVTHRSVVTRVLHRNNQVGRAVGHRYPATVAEGLLLIVLVLIHYGVVMMNQFDEPRDGRQIGGRE